MAPSLLAKWFSMKTCISFVTFAALRDFLSVWQKNSEINDCSGQPNKTPPHHHSLQTDLLQSIVWPCIAAVSPSLLFRSPSPTCHFCKQGTCHMHNFLPNRNVVPGF